MKRLLTILATIALLALLALGAWRLQSTAIDRNLPSSGDGRAVPGQSALTDSALVLLGGFRGILSEIVWFQADRQEAEGEYSRAAQTAAALTRLEPHTPEVWALAAWNLAFNVSATMPTPEERWRWVKAGIELLKNDALALNPGDPAISKSLAEILLIKVASNLDDAAWYYRQHLNELGNFDTPEALALHYATAALPNAKGRLREGLLQEIVQARIIEYRADPAKRDALLDAVNTLRAEFPAPYLDDLATSLAQ